MAEVKKVVEPEQAPERTATIANSNSIPKSDADHLYTYAKNQQQALQTDLPSYRLHPNQYDSLLRSHQSQQMTQDQYLPERTTPVAQTQNMESQKQSLKKSGEKTVPNRSIEEALDKASFRQSKSKIGKSTEKIASGEHLHQGHEQNKSQASMTSKDSNNNSFQNSDRANFLIFRSKIQNQHLESVYKENMI